VWQRLLAPLVLTRRPDKITWLSNEMITLRIN
jgi:hypothetical protein